MPKSDNRTSIFTDEEAEMFVLGLHSNYEKWERKTIKKACKKLCISVQEYKVYRNMLMANGRS